MSNEHKSNKIETEEVQQCIATINRLLDDTNLIYELSEEDRVALMKAAGKLSRPNKDEYEQRKKDKKKAAKRK